jgi:hypothetical protein
MSGWLLLAAPLPDIAGDPECGHAGSWVAGNSGETVRGGVDSRRGGFLACLVVAPRNPDLTETPDRGGQRVHFVLAHR